MSQEIERNDSEDEAGSQKRGVSEKPESWSGFLSFATIKTGVYYLLPRNVITGNKTICMFNVPWSNTRYDNNSVAYLNVKEDHC